nr:RodZ domain-containing protein [Stenotrophomonas maltophilia]
MRQAREAAGLTLEDVGSRLRMPVQVVKSLEEEQWQKLGAPVFVRGQLRSYARLLNVDVSQLLEQAQVGPVVPPTLVSHTHTPRARRIAENLGRRMLYVGITAVLAVPVWFATRGHFDGSATPSPSTASLDAIPAAVPVTPSAAGVDAAAPADATAPAAKPAATPYVASLAPVPRSTPAPAAAANTLEMQFSGDSWVDIGGPDGTTVEKALIKSGESRSFTPGQVARVTLGNASAVQVQQSGAIVDLTPYQRANVARFQVSSEGSVVPVSH